MREKKVEGPRPFFNQTRTVLDLFLLEHFLLYQHLTIAIAFFAVQL